MASFLLSLFLVGILCVVGVASCPSSCECGDGEVDVVCSVNVDDDELVIELSNATSKLRILADSKLTELTSTTFDVFGADSLARLEALDVSEHSIGHVDELVLAHFFPNLVSLNLSSNRLEVVASHMLRGLKHLQTIDFSYNSIESLEDSSLDELDQLTSLDLSQNPLVCDCNLAWFVEFVVAKNLSLINADQTVCSSPLDAINVALMAMDNFICSGQKRRQKQHRNQVIVLEPNVKQVVFEGDQFQVACHIYEMGQHQKISWLIKDTAVKPSSDILIDIDDNAEHASSSALKVVLSIKSLNLNQSGEWTCIVEDDDFEKSRATVDILVLSSDKTKLCPPVKVQTERGVFLFDSTLNGITAKQPCASLTTKEISFASLQCNKEGDWKSVSSSVSSALSVNYTDCAFPSETTSILHKFVTSMTLVGIDNADIGLSTVLESARHLLNFTKEREGLFADQTQALLFLRALNAFQGYFDLNSRGSPTDERIESREEDLLAHYLLSLISSTIRDDSSPEVWREVNNIASSDLKLLSLIEEVAHSCSFNDDFQHISQLLVMKTLERSRRRYSSTTTCTWYRTTTTLKSPGTTSLFGQQAFRSKKAFHCLDARRSHRILNRENKQLLASITITTKRRRRQRPLVVVSFEYGAPSLFPSEKKTSTVIGIVAPNDDPNESYDEEEEEVVVSIRTKNSVNSSHLKPVFWDNDASEWIESPCHFKPSVNSIQVTSESIYTFGCTRVGYYTLIHQNSPALSEETHGNLQLSKSEEQALLLHVGPAFSLILVLVTFSLYSLFFQDLRMTEGLKHCITNTQINIAALLFLFASQGLLLNDNGPICAIVAFVAHLSTLASLGWLTATAREVHAVANEAYDKRLRHNNDFLKTNNNLNKNDNSEDKTKRVALYYVIVYGPILVVVTLTAIVESSYRNNGGFCYVNSEHLLLTILTPCALMTALMTGLLLATWCLTTDPERLLPSRVCPMSADSYKTTRSLSLAMAYVYLLLLSSYLCGALALILPFESQLVPFQPQVLALLFTVSVASLGIFVFIYFVLSRPDVAACWHAPLFSSKLSEQQTLFECGPHATSSMDETTTTPWASLNRPLEANGLFRENNHGSTYDLGGFKIYTELHQEENKENEMERLSLSNFDHLRRGYVAPMNSEADYLVHANTEEDDKRKGRQPSIMSNSSSQMNNTAELGRQCKSGTQVLGDYSEEDQSNIMVVPNTLLKHTTRSQPSTSSPLADNGNEKPSTVDFDVSPLIQTATSAMGHNKSTSAGDFTDFNKDKKGGKFASLQAQYSDQKNSDTWQKQVKSKVAEKSKANEHSSDSGSVEQRHGKRKRVQRKRSSKDSISKKDERKKANTNASSKTSSQINSGQEELRIESTSTVPSSSNMMNTQETSV